MGMEQTVSEYDAMPTDAPLNYAEAVDLNDGTTSIPDAETFMTLAVVNNVGWAPFLDDQLYVKFGILNRDGPNPEVYFINSNTHTVHPAFWAAIDAEVIGDDSSGEILSSHTHQPQWGHRWVLLQLLLWGCVRF